VELGHRKRQAKSRNKVARKSVGRLIRPAPAA
jgi:hypothetical protein